MNFLMKKFQFWCVSYCLSFLFYLVLVVVLALLIVQPSAGPVAAAETKTERVQKAAAEKPMPKHFRYLRDVDPSIVQEMRYFGSHNFLGRRVKGYEAAECILTNRAAQALKKVQKKLADKGLSLKVYDCYRPQRAVNDFIGWSKLDEDTTTKAEFYPTLKKSTLFKRGYIARRSAHSRGSTVDLTIIKLPPAEQPHFSFAEQAACFLEKAARYLDNSLDFGTGYDCFHEKSHTRSPLIGEIARKNRSLLVKEMAAVGFENYSKEWWHFSLKNEPFQKTHFDFPIRPIRSKGDEKPKSIEALIKETALEKAEPENNDNLDKSDEKPSDKVEGEQQQVAILSQPDEDLSPYDLLPVDGALRVVCVADDDVLNVRSVPLNKRDQKANEKNAGSAIVAAIPYDGIGVISRGCTGPTKLARWHELSTQRRREAGTPWCYLVSYKMDEDSEAVPLSGWVSGAYLGGNFTHRKCR